MTRRPFVWMFALAAIIPWAPLVRAQPLQGADRFRSIVVDTSPMAVHGYPGFAAHFRRTMEEEARKVFADRLAPGDPRAPVLVIRVSSVDLGSDITPGGDGRFGTYGAQDTIVGSALVVGADRAILSSTDLFTHLPPNYAGNRFEDPTVNDEHRLEAIGFSFAYWLRRQLNP